MLLYLVWFSYQSLCLTGSRCSKCHYSDHHHHHHHHHHHIRLFEVSKRNHTHSSSPVNFRFSSYSKTSISWLFENVIGYFSSVHPHTLYGVEIYANTYTSCLDKLMKLRNKLLRNLQQKDKYSKNTELYANLITIHYLLPNYTVTKLFALYTNLFFIKISH